jgi:release factor glutamine methyltransferase
LIERSAGRISPGGKMFLEIGHDQAGRVAAIFEQNGWRDIQVAKDYQGAERFVSATI